MQRVTHESSWPLFDAAGTREIERAGAEALAPHALMQRAGHSVARLAMAIAPHAKTIWIACGPGNNGGDGLEAAMHLHQWGKPVVVTWLGNRGIAPKDTLASLAHAEQAGVVVSSEPPETYDIVIDALLGVGGNRPVEGAIASQVSLMNARADDYPRRPVLAVDVPSGLAADTGTGYSVRATHTLSLLTLKPGLFTSIGRDASGEIWFDALGLELDRFAPVATLSGRPQHLPRAHDSHKGSFGDVAVIGGAPGMSGAALLAAAAALHGGAGRVFVALLDGQHDPSRMSVDTTHPELMFREWRSLDLTSQAVACGCGGGDAVRAVLPVVLATAKSLALDADALNAIANDPQLQTQLRTRGHRGHPTVLTPHPLEAARLLGITTKEVQADRLGTCRKIASNFGCVAVLKGSGTVVADSAGRTSINPTGNAKLATAGTGDVLAGLVASRLAAGESPFDAATAAVFLHGLAADRWPRDQALTASALARSL